MPPASSPPPAPVHASAPSSAASADDDNSLDDGDALPAVGKVWDEGPKRSLGEILAAANRRQTTTPQVQPAQRPAPAMADGLAAIWQAALQQVQDELGVSVHVPLASGTPVREGEKLIVRFGGVFAPMSRYLEKYHQQIQQIVSSVAGEALLLQFEASEAASAPPAAAVKAPPVPSRVAQVAHAPSSPGPANAAPPHREGLPLTPELRDQLEKDPLIRTMMEEFNASIVKVEE